MDKDKTTEEYIILRLAKQYLSGQLSNSQDILVVVKVIKTNILALWIMFFLIISSFLDEQIFSFLNEIGSSIKLEYVAIVIALISLIFAAIQTYFAYKAANGLGVRLHDQEKYQGEMESVEIIQSIIDSLEKEKHEMKLKNDESHNKRVN